MKKKNWSELVAAATAILICLTLLFVGSNVVFAQQEKAKKPIVLRVASGLPELDVTTQLMSIPWMKAVEKASGGRVKFDAYYGGTLYKIRDLLDGLQGKGIDIAVVFCPQYTPSRFPYTDVQSLPFGPETAEAYFEATKKLLKLDVFYNQYTDSGIIPLVSDQTPAYLISTRAKKITSIEDFRGLRMRAGNQTMAWFEEALGMTPVFMPGAELGGALQRGVVDGTLLYVCFWPSTGVQDTLKYTIKNFSVGSFFNQAVAIRRDAFQALPADIQEIMKKEAERIEVVGNRALDQKEAELIQKYSREYGAEFYDVPNATLEKMKEASIRVWQRWVIEKEKAGFKHAREVAIAWKNALQSIGVDIPEGVIPIK